MKSSRVKIQHNKIMHKYNGLTHEHEPNTNTKYYYWIWFDRSEGHKGLWGAYSTYEEADRKAVSKLNTPFEIVKLRTRDEGEASRMLRSQLLNETGDVETSFKRFSHKGSKEE